MRPLRTAPLLARIVATLGLMIVLSALAVKVWGSLSVVAPSLFPTDSLTLFDINFGVDRLYLLGVTIVLTVVLWAVYRFTTFGISTRAVAESERGASLLGLSPDLIGAVELGARLHARRVRGRDDRAADDARHLAADAAHPAGAGRRARRALQLVRDHRGRGAR